MSSQFTFDDAYQSAVIGLLVAARKFDPDRGVPFAAYATEMIELSVWDYQRIATQRVIVNKHMLTKVSRFNEARRRFIDEFGEVPLFAELCERIGITSPTMKKNLWQALHVISGINRYPTD